MNPPGTNLSDTRLLPAGRPRPLVVVSNRLPVVLHQDTRGAWSAMPASGGLVSALKPALNKRGGRWIGWWGIEAEKLAGRGLDPQALLNETARKQQYVLEGVPLTQQEIDDYYYGFSNQSLWPLFHGMPERAVFEDRFYDAYRNVNHKFAQKLARSMSKDELVWIHDYQLLAVAEELRRMRTNQAIGLFLHIPFPEPDVLARLPWHDEILRAMFAHDLVGFQTRRDVDHFVACARELAGPVDLYRNGDRAIVKSHFGRTTARAFPIGIDARGFERRSKAPELIPRVFSIRERFSHRRLILGVDRLDYTKGIPHRLRGFRRALREHAELRGTVSLFQLVVPSRTEIPAYQQEKAEIDRLVGEINGEFATTEWIPVHYQYRAVPFEELLALYQAADVCLVTPLIDGMNLVAKEYCATRSDESGVLILSKFAGAAEQLADGALLVDPRDEHAIAGALAEGLGMEQFDQRRRMRSMRCAIRRSDVNTWMRQFMEAVDSVAPSAQHVEPSTSLGPARGYEPKRVTFS